MKKLIKKYLFNIPFLGKMYYKAIFHMSKLNEPAMRSKLQSIGHGIDLYLSEGEKVPLNKLIECECLLRLFQNRKIPIDEAGKWAMDRFVVAKFNLTILKNTSLPSLVSSETKNVFTKILLSRRSVRKWEADRITITDIERIIGIAKWAPTSCNRQPWQVIIINKEKDKHFVKNYFPNTFWMSAPILLIVLMNTQVYGKNESHFAYLDAGSFIQNLLLTLHNEGYGACWIGFKGWDNLGNMFIQGNLYKQFYNYFKLKNDQHLPVSMLAVGRPDEIAKAVPRINTDSIVIKDFCK
jgi:nitroreductase